MMGKNLFFARGKIFLFGVCLAVFSGLAFPVKADENPPDRGRIERQVRETLRRRIDLLVRLTADYERQYKAGSVDGKMVLEAQTELYEAKLLLMKAESGRPAVPGIAAAFIRFYMASGCADEMKKAYSGGQLALSSLLKAQLGANSAELDFLRALQTQPYHADRLHRLSAALRKPDVAVRLDDKFLRSVLEIEK